MEGLRRAEEPPLLSFAFGPFPGVEDNASRFAAAAASEQAQILSVSYAAVDAHVEAMPPGPLRVLAFGMAAASSAPRVELQARNRDSSPVADVEGCTRQGIIDHGAPDMLQGDWTAELLAGLAPFGVEPSEDAGGYLCNHLYWRLLRRPQTAAVFIHLPLGREPGWYAAIGAACARVVRGGQA